MARPCVTKFVGNSSVTICHRLRDINSQNVYDLESDHSELVNIKCKCASREAACDFLGVGSSNICPICHRLRDNHV